MTDPATIAISLPFPIPVNNMYGNSPRGGRRMTQKYLTWRRVAATEIMAQRPAWAIKAIDGPVRLHVSLQRPDNKKRDLDNLLKCIQDVLVKMRTIQDDQWIHEIHADWLGDEPCRVTLTAM